MTGLVAALIDGSLLGMFMISACAAVVAFYHPRSPIARAIGSPLQRRAAVALLMGLTAIALIYSPLGTRSGAHMNPGVTLTFWTLGKVPAVTAAFYVLSQFAGALGGVTIARIVMGDLLAHASVSYAATKPGRFGTRGAWLGEFVIAFLTMSMVLWTSNQAPLAPYTGIFAGVMVAAFITIEAPISGMSMNPARTLGSAVPARAWHGLWVYFTAPPLAMLAAAAAYTAVRGVREVYCAKLHHDHAGECVFNCRIGEMPGWNPRPSEPAGIKHSDAER